MSNLHKLVQTRFPIVMRKNSTANGARTSTVFGLLALLGFMLLGLFLSSQLVARSPQSVEDELRKLDSTGAIHYLSLVSRSPEVVDDSFKMIDKDWHPGSAMMLVEIVRFVPSRPTIVKLFEILEAKTGQKFGPDLDKWHQWIWGQEYQPHPGYAEFKSVLYSRIDPRFVEYFKDADKLNIRLDQIQWGGVRRDGIPPLKNPKMLAASDADYLSDTDVVFGIDLNNDARCYPKRILAWHEMFKDTIGGESVCGVY